LHLPCCDRVAKQGKWTALGRSVSGGQLSQPLCLWSRAWRLPRPGCSVTGQAATTRPASEAASEGGLTRACASSARAGRSPGGHLTTCSSSCTRALTSITCSVLQPPAHTPVRSSAAALPANICANRAFTGHARAGDSRAVRGRRAPTADSAATDRLRRLAAASWRPTRAGLFWWHRAVPQRLGGGRWRSGC